MGLLLFLCVTAFLGLFLINNAAEVMLSSPMAVGLAAVALVADLYLLRALVRDWTRKHD